MRRASVVPLVLASRCGRAAFAISFFPNALTLARSNMSYLRVAPSFSVMPSLISPTAFSFNSFFVRA